MTLVDRLEEAFDKKVGGTAMIYASDLLSASGRIQQLEKIIERQQFIEDRYEELMLSARRVYRYYGVDDELLDASIKVLDFLIRRHKSEMDEMDEMHIEDEKN